MLKAKSSIRIRKLERTEFGNYCFYLYLNLEEGNKVEVPVESKLPFSTYHRYD